MLLNHARLPIPTLPHANDDYTVRRTALYMVLRGNPLTFNYYPVDE